jgi:hypothetical protein
MMLTVVVVIPSSACVDEPPDMMQKAIVLAITMRTDDCSKCIRDD